MQALGVSQLDVVGRLGEDKIDLFFMDGGFEFGIGKRDEFQPAATDVGVEIINQRLPALAGFRFRAEGEDADAGGQGRIGCGQCQQRQQAQQHP